MKIMSHLWGKLQLTPTNELIPTLNPALASGACSQGLELVGFSKLRESLLSALSATSLASSKAWMGFGEGGWIHEVVAMGHGPAPGSSLLPLDTRNRTQAPSDSAPAAPQAAATPTCSHAATCSALSHLPAFQLLFSGPGMPSSCSGIHSKPPPHRSPLPPKLPARQNQSTQHSVSVPGAHAWCSSSHGVGTAAGPPTAQAH